MAIQLYIRSYPTGKSTFGKINIYIARLRLCEVYEATADWAGLESWAKSHT